MMPQAIRPSPARYSVGSRLRQCVHRSHILRSAAFMVQNVHAALRRPQVRIVDRPRRYYLAAMVRVKDEGRFLPEWIAHHLNLGVEHIYIYDNASTDCTTRTLEPYIETGLVTLVPWPARPISPGADLSFLQNYGAEAHWVAFLDADEFIWEEEPGALLDILSRSVKAPAIALNWRYFGSSYHDKVPDGLVVENFPHCDIEFDSHIKVIAQTAYIHRYRTPHNFYYRHGRLARTPDGKRAIASFARITRLATPRVYIRHFVYRGREDYVRKIGRGHAESRGDADRARRESRIDSEFVRHNDVVMAPDQDIVRTIKDRMTALGYDARYHGKDNS